ncbi:HAD family hydrolase [Okibacterium endophyticum]
MRRLDDTTILFDWNGTIVLDADRARDALNGVLAARELPGLDAQQFGDRFLLPMRELFSGLGVERHQLADAEAEWNLGMQAGEPVARAGLREMLVGMHHAGARLGIVSAASEASIATDLRALRLPDLWACVHGGVADKPRVLREERRGRAGAIYVGDTVYDMTSAVSAGYRAIGVTDGYTSAERLLAAGAELIVSDLRKLEDLFERVA